MATLNEHTSVLAAILSDIFDHSDTDFIYILSCINSITRLGLLGTRDRGRPRKTWSACVRLRNDMTICNLDGVNPLDRNSCQVLPTPESGTTAAP